MVFVNQLTTWVGAVPVLSGYIQTYGGGSHGPINIPNCTPSIQKERKGQLSLHMEKYDSLVYLALGGY